MHIHKHPPVTLEVYTDGRIHYEFDHTQVRIRDALKIGAIEVALRKYGENLGQEIGPGRYRVILTEYSLRTKMASLEFKPL